MSQEDLNDIEEGELEAKDFADDYQYDRVTLDQIRSRDINEDYEVLHEVGSGTYGRVYKANRKSVSNKLYALKQLDVSQEKDGFPITALREIKLLQKLDQENVLKINEIVTMRTSKDKGKSKITTFLVFDYMEHDFQGLIRKKQPFTQPQIKCVMQQLFKGLDYLHNSNVIHRDLKSANLLLNKDGVLKIGDFGLARQVERPLLRPLTSVVVTLWYRAPEILLGDKNYSFKSDVWSAGCFMAELLLGEPIFNGKNESTQIEQIYEKCGSPDPDSWAGLTTFKFWKDLQPKKEYSASLISYMKQKIPTIDSSTLDFLQALLTMNPEERLDSNQALHHEYFEREPLPCPVSEMPHIEQDCHFQPTRSQINSQDHMPVPKRHNYSTAPPKQFNKYQSNPSNNSYGYNNNNNNNQHANGQYNNQNKRKGSYGNHKPSKYEEQNKKFKKY
ncbi:cyclin-dependent kinase-like Serine/Threonine kinase family protein (macronuclear) [Tetrahymena thermophila SB210]|uniref:Cyclin-dependent kinase 2 homolog n=1 Tax=Tetrahymena thermophila (strain SB210) TaxID=312017 RepID=A4VDF1_TETTS|nr:cyclin-dependent kinase-like Serine/Threonine kinase family protein [Tetrahymena thermophila SB210]EDK31565.1 cyclin-dependent kinase-like Serine/Threonine kinase family protein [Tetrahymena thermophila SB210]|eukprot:XP_001470879.1 cyclin-dependent kinase-like Serine/Threonine kinase family protein [Tetrahymena thermophila SB210]